jgi:hypothetical protein
MVCQKAAKQPQIKQFLLISNRQVLFSNDTCLCEWCFVLFVSKVKPASTAAPIQRLYEGCPKSGRLQAL